MKKLVILFIFTLMVQGNYAQCPSGPRHNFWHPDQIDSFKVLYPNCDKFDFQTTMINGEYVKPSVADNGNNLLYILCLIGVLALILFLLKMATDKIAYFKG